MEVEFVNEYISKLVAKVHDLTNQNLMLETRLALLDRALSESNVELQALKQKNEKKKQVEDSSV
jgi:hypothetical protein